MVMSFKGPRGKPRGTASTRIPGCTPYPSPGRYSHFLITFIPFLFLFFRSIPSMQMWPSLLFCRVAVREDRAWFSLVTVVKAQSLLWYLELTVHRCSYGGIYSWQALTVSGLKVNSNKEVLQIEQLHYEKKNAIPKRAWNIDNPPYPLPQPPNSRGDVYTRVFGLVVPFHFRSRLVKIP